MSGFRSFQVWSDTSGTEFYFKIEDDENHVLCDFRFDKKGLYYYTRKSQVLSEKEKPSTLESWDSFLSLEKLYDLFQKLHEIGCIFPERDDSSLNIKKDISKITIKKIEG
jgi:hypothetical protein